MRSPTIPTLVLGGSGYVSAELIRLLAGHPSFRLDCVVSSSHAGERIETVFPHFAGALGDLAFSGMEEAKQWIDSKRRVALFSALPHGEAASLSELLAASSAAEVSIVDMSADFRLSDPEAFSTVYGMPHGAPGLYSEFTCALPDLPGETPEGHVSHPGCFTTCVALGAAPFLKLGLLAEPKLAVSAVTGSTGAGRQPRTGTHHPERQSALWAYDPLRHRHTHEMRRLLAHDGVAPDIAFVPHSGPFSRGIHATIFADLSASQSPEELVGAYTDFYSGTPFVETSLRLPSVKEVVGSNRCHIGIAVEGTKAVVTCVIDNLVKGAAGGAVQWMNRLFALEPSQGLTTPMPGWI